jgi:phage terminase small subunit
MAEPVPFLSDKELRFVEEYSKDRNGVRAALAAGVHTSYFHAAQAAHVLLKKPEIRSAIRKVWAVQAKRLRAEVPDIVREWAVVGTADVTDYAVDADGRVRSLPGVPKVALRAVKKVKQTRTEKLDRNNGLTVEVKTEIELHDKLRALSDLYKHLHGALPGETAGSGTEMPVEYAAEFAEFLAAKRLRGVVPADVPVVPETGGSAAGVPERSG